MSRHVEPERVFSLLAVAGIQGGYLTVDEAARLLGVDADEVPAIVVALADLGVPPFEADDSVDIFLERGAVAVQPPLALMDLLNFSPIDCAMLLASVRALRPGLDRKRLPLCDGVIARLTAVLGDEHATDAVHRSQQVAWEVSDAAPAAIVDVLSAAIRHRSVVVLRYYNSSRDALEDRSVRPHRLVEHGGRWYVSATVDPSGAHRYWRLDRVLAAEPTPIAFAGEGPDPAAIRRDLLYDAPEEGVRVEVRFDANAVERARAWFAGRASETPEPGGAVRMTLSGPTVPVVLRELLRFGDGYSLIGPSVACATAAAWARQHPTP